MPRVLLSYLLDFSLQVSQLDALLQVAPVLLGRQVQLLLLLVEELQQVLDPRRHVHVPVAQQLHACGRETLRRQLLNRAARRTDTRCSRFTLNFVCFLFRRLKKKQLL